MTKQDQVVTEAIISLRAGLEQSMAEFAKTMGISLSSVVRFEQGVIPKRAFLERFAEVARQNGYVTHEVIFQTALIAETPDVAAKLRHLLSLEKIFVAEVKDIGVKGGLSINDFKALIGHLDAVQVILREGLSTF